MAPRKKPVGDASGTAQSDPGGLAVSTAQGSVQARVNADGPQSADPLSGTPQNDLGSTRITRSIWPEDEAERLVAIAACIPQALADYHDNAVVIAAALHLLPEEVEQAINDNPKFARAQKVFQNAVCARLEDVLVQGALSERNQTSAKYLLERIDPNRWGKPKKSDDDETPKPAPVPETPPPVYKKESES